VRKGEKGSLVVYADKIIRTETNGETGEESEHAIPFMKGYTVFNAEQIDGLSDLYYAKPAPPTLSIQRIVRVEAFFAATGAIVRHGGNAPTTASAPTMCRCRPSRVSAMQVPITRRSDMKPRIMP
jgi:antirestriction protein ArdC